MGCGKDLAEGEKVLVIKEIAKVSLYSLVNQFTLFYILMFVTLKILPWINKFYLSNKI